MKILPALAATVVALTGITAAAPAAAQHRVVHERTVVRHERHWGNNHRRTVCDWQQRGHRRVRVCRTIR